MRKNEIGKYGGMEEYICMRATPSFKKYHNDRTCYDAYCELKKNLEPVQKTVGMGAMAEEIKECIALLKSEIDAIARNATPDCAANKIHEFFASDPVLFLNDHGPEHISKVIECANAILKNFEKDFLSEFECFILLCAIQIHDIGNVLGRAGHEQKLNEIFEQKSANIIVDTPEKRIIKSIAMAHGGRSESGKDTISRLSANELLFNEPVRTRLLAALLRFSDELADDSTRANREALDLNIIGTSSEIYHEYSRALHTVAVEPDGIIHGCKVSLRYELEAPALEKTYQVGGHPKYLLDEIYDRTLKMELERRYCMKFMYPYINIGRIEVQISIYGTNSQRIENISYTLEDVSYPNETVSITGGTMCNLSVPSGEEMHVKLIEWGEINGKG